MINSVKACVVNGIDSFNGPNYNGLNNNFENNSTNNNPYYFNNGQNNLRFNSSRYNIDTYQKIFTNIDTYMKGYSPYTNNLNLNNSYLKGSYIQEKGFVNDTEFQEENNIEYKNSNNDFNHNSKSVKNSNVLEKVENQNNYKTKNTNINYREFNKINKGNKFKEKIYKSAEKTEISIDKLRDFLVNLFNKYTQKETLPEYYDAENVNTKNKQNSFSYDDSSEVASLKNDTIIVNNSYIENAFTNEEILYLKNLIKQNNENTDNINNKISLTSEEKLNLINKIINSNIFEELDNDFKNYFHEPLFKNNGSALYKNSTFVKENIEDKTSIIRENNQVNENSSTDSKEVMVDNNIITAPKNIPSNDNNISPLPSPFDPVKMDEINEKQKVEIDETDKTDQPNESILAENINND